MNEIRPESPAKSLPASPPASPMELEEKKDDTGASIDSRVGNVLKRTRSPSLPSDEGRPLQKRVRTNAPDFIYDPEGKAILLMPSPSRYDSKLCMEHLQKFAQDDPGIKSLDLANFDFSLEEAEEIFKMFPNLDSLALTSAHKDMAGEEKEAFMRDLLGCIIKHYPNLKALSLYELGESRSLRNNSIWDQIGNLKDLEFLDLIGQGHISESLIKTLKQNNKIKSIYLGFDGLPSWQDFISVGRCCFQVLLDLSTLEYLHFECESYSVKKIDPTPEVQRGLDFFGLEDAIGQITLEDSKTEGNNFRVAVSDKWPSPFTNLPEGSSYMLSLEEVMQSFAIQTIPDSGELEAFKQRYDQVKEGIVKKYFPNLENKWISLN